MQNENYADILRVQGVNSKGYGTVPKLVMLDDRLSGSAKLIYSYFCSFAGAGDTAFPSVKKIMHDLKIKNIETFSKHRNMLVDCGYITVEQVKEKGKFGRNIYTLITNPIAIESSPGNESGDKKAESEKTRVGKNPSPKIPHYIINSIYKTNKTKKTTTIKKAKTVVVDSISKEFIQEYKDKINTAINDEVSDKAVIELIQEHGVDKINKYLDNWKRFDLSQIKSNSAFFISAVKDGYAIPAQKYTNDNRSNFREREYNFDINSLYSNVNRQ